MHGLLLSGVIVYTSRRANVACALYVRGYCPVTVDRGMSSGRGARIARRDERGYREYLSRGATPRGGMPRPGIVSRTTVTEHKLRVEAVVEKYRSVLIVTTLAMLGGTLLAQPPAPSPA